MTNPVPSLDDVHAAATRLAGQVTDTPFLE
ncbi:MAG: hypothetical protein RI988_1214, partial [Pseudomonadota bacterium]